MKIVFFHLTMRMLFSFSCGTYHGRRCMLTSRACLSLGRQARAAGGDAHARLAARQAQATAHRRRDDDDGASYLEAPEIGANGAQRSQQQAQHAAATANGAAHAATGVSVAGQNIHHHTAHSCHRVRAAPHTATLLSRRRHCG